MQSRSQYLMIIIVLLVFVGTAYLMFARLPEERVVTSADGMITVEASVGSDVSIEITLGGVSTVQQTAVIGNVYFVEPSEVILSEPATVIMRYTDELLVGEDPGRLMIGYYDMEARAWRALPSRLDRTTQELSAETGHLSSWALLVDRQIELPLALNDLIQELTSQPLAGATGYVVEVAYTLTGKDYVLVPGNVVTGGCGGIYESGQRQEWTEGTGSYRAMVDGVTQTVDFRVIVKWEIAEGCFEFKPFGPSLRE
ncbi:hypothetical protein KJ910_02775 [Patescibacteria group bacterium]|nr:hypothetical protein [Patescibacteria group bacterium]MBU1906663.1 hypothetical protein [Patescibacteria group bacterium]